MQCYRNNLSHLKWILSLLTGSFLSVLFFKPQRLFSATVSYKCRPDVDELNKKNLSEVLKVGYPTENTDSQTNQANVYDAVNTEDVKVSENVEGEEKGVIRDKTRLYPSLSVDTER